MRTEQRCVKAIRGSVEDREQRCVKEIRGSVEDREQRCVKEISVSVEDREQRCQPFDKGRPNGQRHGDTQITHTSVG